MHALDLFSYKIVLNEYVWFNMPVRVADAPCRLIGQVTFARDYQARDGIAGAAIVVADRSTNAMGFSGPMLKIDELFGSFTHACIDKVSNTLTFGSGPTGLAEVPCRQYSGSQFHINKVDILRLRLPADWFHFISMPELLGVIRKHGRLQ